MAHGRKTADVVMTTRYVGMREIHAVSRHELERHADGSSAIDPERSHLNKVLLGPATQSDAIDGMLKQGVKGPTKQADTPFVQMVLSASPQFFRKDSDVVGTFEADRLKVWVDETMGWAKREYGQDLAHASLHLDEDTPHIHMLIVPTYSRKPRKPGRRRKNETVEDFEARKAAAASGESVRTMSRSSNDKWKQTWARRDARISYYKSLKHLGLGYGKDFVGSGDASPPRKETGQWVREQAAEVKREKARVKEQVQAVKTVAQDTLKERAEVEEARKGLDQKALHLDRRERDLNAKVAQFERREEVLFELVRGVKRVVARCASMLGIDLPRRLTEAVSALDAGLERYEKERDPFSEAEDPGDQVRPGL